MIEALKRLSPGLFLIVLAAVVLLLSDLRQRSATNIDIPRVAILTYASRPVLEEGQDGILNSLKDNGFIQGQNIDIKVFNAENDLPTANTMAAAIVDADFDMVISISTPCLQAMASANRYGKLIHVFGLVTDPFSAGVGINPDDPADHPAHLAGIGTFQPVKEAFRLAKEMYPALASVGVVWNPAEGCSEACTLMARDICRELGITLQEATVDNSAGVLEAARSLVARGVECLWIGGDNTVEIATSSVVKAATEGGIPVFTNSPSTAKQGALFGLGANYFEVGKETGNLAAQILKGLDPATVRIEDMVPERLVLNLSALKGLKNAWSIPDQIRARAEVVGQKYRQTQVSDSIKWENPSGKLWKLSLIHYVETPLTEDMEKGVLEQFEHLGLKQGVDFEINIRSSQRDMATLAAIMDAVVVAESPDLVLTTSTPALQAALKKIKGIPLVFSVVANPILAGAGTSFEEHLPNVTGIATMGAFEEMVDIVKQCIPDATRIGTLFVPTEINSVFYMETFSKVAEEKGLMLVTVGVSTSAEVPDAALSLIGKGIDAICQISDNLNNSAFSGIAQAARKSRTPLFGFVSAHVLKNGAALALARDYVQSGRDTVNMAVRIMMGESPQNIPFAQVSKTLLVINMDNAAAFDLNIPQEILDKADIIVP